MTAKREGQQVDTLPVQIYGKLPTGAIYPLQTDADGNIKTVLSSHICAENTTQTPILAGATFTGEWQDALDYGVISIGIIADQDSATNGLVIEWSADGTNAVDSDTFSIFANIGKTFTFGPARRYVRVKYTNGTVNQTSFNLETSFRKVYVKPSSHRVNDEIVGEDDAELVKSVLAGIDDDGHFKNVKTTHDGNLTISDNSSGLSIAKGEVTGTTFIHKFGNAPDFDTIDGIVDIWDGANDGGINAMVYTYSTIADIDSLSSSDNGDTQDIEVQGLDANYDTVTQTITLTGQTRVPLTTNLIRVFRMKNVNSTDNAGRIFCFVNVATTGGVPNTVTNIRAVMGIGNNQTLMALYTIPNGKTGYMRDWYASIAGASKTSNFIVDVRARPFGQVFQIKHRSAIADAGTSYIQHQYLEPEVFSAKTDIAMRVAAQALGATAASISAGFDIVLIDN